MAHEYWVEQMGGDERWFVRGSMRTSGDAQDYMREQLKLFPRGCFRVTEHPGAKLIVCTGWHPAWADREAL